MYIGMISVRLDEPVCIERLLDNLILLGSAPTPKNRVSGPRTQIANKHFRSLKVAIIRTDNTHPHFSAETKG